MKTIVLLTNFSPNAETASFYALKLAQKIKAGLLLCNIYQASDEGQSLKAGRFGENEEKSIFDLGELLVRLKAELDTADPMDYRPDIAQYSKKGSIDTSLTEIVAKYDVLMAVISRHRDNCLNTLLLSNHALEIVERAGFPVLILPYQANYNDFKTIAFATDSAETDIEALNSLKSLANYSHSKIMIANVTDQNEKGIQMENSDWKALDQGIFEVLKPDILYKGIKNHNVSESLMQLTQHIQIDMLVMVRHKQSALKQLIDGNVIAEMADHPAKPLLIFPYANPDKPLRMF